MPFIDTTHPNEAKGTLRAMYERQQASFGYVPNYAKVFSHRPEIMELWAALLKGLQQHLDRRRFELCTLAAAQALGSSYCSLAHGKVLTKFYSAAEIRALLGDPATAPITEAEAAMMRLARKVACASSTVTDADVEELREHGFSDEEIFDVVGAAAGRAFFANLVEGLGAQADPIFRELDEHLRDALTVGRPIDGNDPERITVA